MLVAVVLLGLLAAVDSRLRGNDEEKKLGLRRKEAGMATWGRGSGALWRFFI